MAYEEYSAFRKWLEDTYGYLYTMDFDIRWSKWPLGSGGDIRTHPQYNRWVSLGRPSKGTKPEGVGGEAEPLPVVETPSVGKNFQDWSITHDEWKKLLGLGNNSAAVIYMLNTLIGQGRMDNTQAGDIWEALKDRIKPNRSEVIAQLKQTGEVGVGGIPKYLLETWEDKIKAGTLSREAVENYVQKRMDLQEKATHERKFRSAFEAGALYPDYGIALEEAKTTGMGGAFPATQTSMEWFRSQYPTIVKQFEATLPKWGTIKKEGLTPGEVRRGTAKLWTEYLKEQKTPIREQFYNLNWYERGERSQVFAPRVQTVGFT